MQRRRGATTLSDILNGCLAPTLRKQGFGESEIVTGWAEIVGPRLAAVSAPIRLVWPGGTRRDAAGDPRPAALAVRVEGAFALELQHLAPLVIERVNAHLGWRCVDRVTLRQGPLPLKPARAAPPPAPDAAALAAARAATEGVADEALRAALTRLGARVATERRRKD
ncbi:MAG: DUF721 domain-containing protein [Methylobacteriaceae bacterium]|nr:DUF721 domain-containing protein [Methylobacteriaceae bacterium]